MHDNTLYIGENIQEVGEEKSKCYADICHPEAKPKDLGRFFADAQHDRSNFPLPLREGEVVQAERVTTSGEGKKEIPGQVRDDKEYSLALREKRSGRGDYRLIMRC